ncbi:MAG TPA: SUF system NifU family Fe-S cluster assembly protein [Burkholderiales bacterium]|nr:SUF system NifU family Fe-S cluster assembly protein [Burkholderiales bacterium]
MVQSIYDDLILDHIKNARNYRELPRAQRRAEGINPLCGDTFTVYLEIEGERIREAAFQCSCCGISMASASVMTQLVRERTLEEAAELVKSFTRLIRHPDEASEEMDEERRAILSVVRASPARGNCAALAWHTMGAALQGRDSLVLQPESRPED